MNTLPTLAQVRQYLGLAAPAFGVLAGEDLRLMIAARTATAHIQRITERRFLPRLATIAHHFNPRLPTELLLDDDLLTLLALTDAAGVIPLEAACLVPDDTAPTSTLILTNGWAFSCDALGMASVSVRGVWGWHDDPAQMWRDSGDTVRDAVLAAGTTTLTVSDVAAPDALGSTPRFQVGQLLKIDEEYVLVLTVTQVTDADDVLTVQRGINGTTAAQHVQGAAIAVYQPPADILDLALRWTAWFYRLPELEHPPETAAALRQDTLALRRVAV